MPQPLVEFREVSKRFGAGPPVLEGLRFSVAPGEFVSVIGPSGCGKSTLLRLIAGLSPISGGVLSVDGTTPENAAPRLAFVFQDATLLPWLTAEQNILLPQRLRDVPPAERAARSARVLDLVRLAPRAHAYPRQLSGGQRMRVSLARALALAPKLLLLDEPFGALDEMTRERLNEELLAIRDVEGWTAFFVTHSVAEAVFLSTRVLVLSANPGRLHADIAVALPYPRTSETRLSADYHACVDRVTRVLRDVEVATA